MQIRNIHIEGFGHFRDHKVGPFQPGLNVIHGPNELGKTTLLEFVRRVLFGFPDRRENLNFYGVERGAGQGGRIHCLTRSGETLYISRQPGPGGGAVIVGTDEGDQDGDGVLGRYLGHASKDIFRNIFAFTIDELQSLDSLSGKETQNRLYGAGLGSLSLAEAERDIEKMTQDLFKPRGSSQPMALALKRMRELSRRIQDIQNSLAGYDKKVSELGLLKEKAGNLRRDIDALEKRQQALDLRLALTPVAEEGRRAKDELAELEDIAEFPADGLETLARHKTEEKNLALQIDDAEAELRLAGQKLEHLLVDDDLLEREAEVLALKESTQEIRSALRDRPALALEQRHATETIGESARQIGPGWDEARAMAFTWTEADQASVQKQHRALEAARAEVLAAREKLNYHREQQAKEEGRVRGAPFWVTGFAGFLLVAGALGGLWGFLKNETLFTAAMGLMLACGLALLILTRAAKPPPATDEPLDHLLAQNLLRAEQNLASLANAWRAWLEAKQLDPGLEPQDAERMAARIREIRIQVQERNRLVERLGRMDETLGEAKRRAQTFDPGGDLKPEDLPARITHLGQALEAARENLREKTALATRTREAADKIERLKKRRAENRAELERFLNHTGSRDEEDLKRRQAVFNRRRELAGVIERAARQIEARVGSGDTFARFMECLSGAVPAELEQELARVAEKLDALQKENDALNRQIGETQSLTDQLESNDELQKAQAEMEMEKEKLRTQAGEWATGRIALSVLALARGKYENERQPQVLISAGGFLSAITDGKYVKVIKPVTGDLVIEDAEGERRGVLEMSRGTREQLYLAMRLGLIEEYEKRSEPLPVIMDDVLINFDDARGERVVELLSRFAGPRQVIVMTCHRRSLAVYKNHNAHPVHI